MRHPDEARLNDYVDGLLAGDETADVEAHLEACDECAGRVASLRSLRDRLAALPMGIPPGRDLRPGIRERLESTATAPSDPPDVIPGPAHVRGAEGARPATAGLRPWLRAAAVVAVLFGAGVGVWLGVRPEPRATAAVEIEATMINAYVRAVDELAAAVQARRTELDPVAVRALEANLAAVDAAIRELESARPSAADRAALERHLEGRYRTKLELLRSALARMETS